MRLTMIIGLVSALTFGVSCFYFMNQKTDVWRLDLANQTIKVHERSLDKLSEILAETSAIRYDEVLEFVSAHEEEFWTDSEDEFKYIYFEYLILTFDTDGNFVSIRTNSL